MDLDQDLFEYLLEILRCPVCQAKVVAKPDRTALKCEGCKLVYPMRNNVPIMLKEQATLES